MNSRSWWWTGRPGVLRFMGSQRVRHDWATELNWTELRKWIFLPFHAVHGVFKATILKWFVIPFSSGPYFIDGHEFEQALSVGGGQGNLACCSHWGHKEPDTTDQLNWTEKENEINTNNTHPHRYTYHTELHSQECCWLNTNSTGISKRHIK